MNTMWRSTVMLMLSLILGAAAMSFVWWSISRELFARNIIIFGIFLSLATIQFLTRNKLWREASSGWIFILAVIAISSMTCINNYYFMHHHLSFHPFLGIKTMAALLLLVCPPMRWVGWTSFAILFAFPLTYMFWEPTARNSMGVQEPFFTFVVVVTALAFYHYRLKLVENLETEIRSGTQLRSLQQFAGMLVASRHLIATPLQKIEILIYLVLKDHPKGDQLIRQFDSNFDTIRQVTRIMTIAESQTQWERLALPADAAQLERQVSEMMRDLGEKENTISVSSVRQ